MDYTVTWPAEHEPQGRLRIGENLCHVHLPNGWTVSILQLEHLIVETPAWWETWPTNPAGEHQTPEPEHHATFDEAWDTVEHWAKM